MSNAVFKITPEPDWPHGEYTPPYSFSVGYQPNQLLLASALTPRTKTGQVDVRTRLVLHDLLFRLNVAQVRWKRKDNPEFGPYRYAWFSLSEMALSAGLSERQVQKSMASLVSGGIVYRVRATNYEHNSYRLTDPAFMMAHTLQFPMLKMEWLRSRSGEIDKPKSWWDDLREAVEWLRKNFPETIHDMRETFDTWHTKKNAKGERLDPYEFGLVEEYETATSKLFAPGNEADE